MTKNTLPALTDVPEGFVVLPPHMFNETGKCLFCPVESDPKTYAEYVESWYRTEYEGPVVESDGYQWTPEPETEQMWSYLRDSCLG